MRNLEWIGPGIQPRSDLVGSRKESLEDRVDRELGLWIER